MNAPWKPAAAVLDKISRNLVQETSDGIVVIDVQQTIEFINGAALRMFGYTEDEVLGESLNKLIPYLLGSTHASKVKEFVESGERSSYMGQPGGYMPGLRSDGTELMLGASILRIDVGDECFLAATLRDVSAYMNVLGQATGKMNSDPLTGIANRRQFLERIKKSCSRASKHQTEFSVLIFDVDNFKGVNDSFGHGAGDKILCDFAEIVGCSLRSVDTFARWGGDEFVALLPHTSLDGATKTAERIRQEVEKARLFSPSGEHLMVTVSIGISHCTGTSGALEELLSDADNALYRAKATGRNRVMAAPSCFDTT